MTNTFSFQEGLDFIEAHVVVNTQRRWDYPPIGSGEPYRATGFFDIVTCSCGWRDDSWDAHRAHVASIVGLAHTSFCNDRIEDGTGTAHVCVGECAEAERVAQAERIAELEAEIVRRQEAAEIIGALHAKVCDDVARAVGVEVDPNGDADWAGIFELLAELGSRAEKAEETIAKWEAARRVGAALEGEQSL